ncbi:MAG: DNA-protecting protein DprA [Anaerolineae bacterium]|nr:DNA-protecting protein DprA [Anaerolineae bacterium]
MNSEDSRFWLGFSLIPGIGIKRLKLLLEAFGTLAAAWSASDMELKRAGLGDVARTQVLKSRAQLDLKAEVAKVQQVGASLLTLNDETYPPLLKMLPDAPPLLYVSGELIPADQRSLAMVGTRKATRYGQDAALDLASKLAAQGITIISGLAPGIDAAAHEGALRGGGRTIAVLGSGIDVIYPREHHDLARRITRSGALISEFPIGTRPEGRNFPRRNRVISGLSPGVLVVEAPVDSGALITANMAAEQGREVFAVPANIYNPMGAGANRLIQDGAKLVMGIEDILDELNIAHEMVTTRTRTEQVIPANATEATVLQYLSADAVHIDEIIRLSGLPTPVVSSTLTLLELKGLAQMVGHMQYSLIY